MLFYTNKWSIRKYGSYNKSRITVCGKYFYGVDKPVYEFITNGMHFLDMKHFLLYAGIDKSNIYRNCEFEYFIINSKKFYDKDFRKPSEFRDIELIPFLIFKYNTGLNENYINSMINNGKLFSRSINGMVYCNYRDVAERIKTDTLNLEIDGVVHYSRKNLNISPDTFFRGVSKRTIIPRNILGFDFYMKSDEVEYLDEQLIMYRYNISKSIFSRIKFSKKTSFDKKLYLQKELPYSFITIDEFRKTYNYSLRYVNQLLEEKQISQFLDKVSIIKPIAIMTKELFKKVHNYTSDMLYEARYTGYVNENYEFSNVQVNCLPEYVTESVFCSYYDINLAIFKKLLSDKKIEKKGETYSLKVKTEPSVVGEYYTRSLLTFKYGLNSKRFDKVSKETKIINGTEYYKILYNSLGYVEKEFIEYETKQELIDFYEISENDFNLFDYLGYFHKRINGGFYIYKLI